MSGRFNIIEFFTKHRVAANLLLLIFIVGGIWGLSRLNTQILPTYTLRYVTVTTHWPGANATDVKKSITIPLENSLYNLHNLKHMSSISRTGYSYIVLTFSNKVEMDEERELVERQVELTRGLPEATEETAVIRIEPFEPILSILIKGTKNRHELNILANKMERQLLAKGINKIDVLGNPRKELLVQLSNENIAKLNLTLADIGRIIVSQNIDTPLGTSGNGHRAKVLRSIQQRKNVRELERLPVKATEDGQYLTLGQIANIKEHAKFGDITLSQHGNLIAELRLFRSQNMDTLTSAALINKWIKDIQPTLPKGIKVEVYNQSWTYLKARLNTLIKNGIGGLALVFILLIIFLNARVALWVGIGLPGAVLGSFFIIYLLGGSINVISIFAIILSLGFIVDDAIVVSDEISTLLKKSHPITQACTLGAQRMFFPVIASSLTTIAAFLPLFLVSGMIGEILSAIPQMVICVLITSVLSAFLILPGHLSHSFKKTSSIKRHKLGDIIDKGVEHFKQGIFRKLVTVSINNRISSIALVIGLLLFAIGLLLGNKVHFTFYSKVPSNIIYTNIEYNHIATPRDKNEFMMYLENTLYTINLKLTNKNIIKQAIIYQNTGVIDIYKGKSEARSAIMIELTSPNTRKITNNQLINQWRKQIKLPKFVNTMTIEQLTEGPPGHDITIELLGPNYHTLKKAANSLKNSLQKIVGISNVNDNLPYGKEQLSIRPNALARSKGISVEDISHQISSINSGVLVQIMKQPSYDVDVRIIGRQKPNTSNINHLPIIIDGLGVLPLGALVDTTSIKGFDSLPQINGKKAVVVTADVNTKTTNAVSILKSLTNNELPNITKKFNISYHLTGPLLAQKNTLDEMIVGALVAIILIYIILAWVSASYALPICMMIIIPLAAVGAVIGHWLLHVDMTILSLFGLFGLSGIVLNGSIILINRYNEIRDNYASTNAALVEAACQRLRPVLLTSITTIVALLPLLFETSVQAQFLIPMVISLVFGLIFSMFLVLLIIPALISVCESLKKTFRFCQN